VSHTYAKEGSFTARLTAVDGRGMTATATLKITVGASGAAQEQPSTGACGLGVAQTLTVGLVGLLGFKRRSRRRL
jgi:hypothetical protein